MRLFGRTKGPLPPSRQNTQHFVAAVVVESSSISTKHAVHHLKTSFQRTSELPCEYWESTGILLGTNYPGCIVEGRDFVGLCSGLPYCSDHTATQNNNDKNIIPTIIQQAVTLADDLFEKTDHNLATVQTELSSQLLVSLRGHWAMVLCHKATENLLVWNDAFGFMPVFSYQNQYQNQGKAQTSLFAVSSYWDCLVPRRLSTDHQNHLTWNETALAEYILFGTTIRNETFLQGLTNLEPGSCMVLQRHPTDGTVSQEETHISVTTTQYVQSYGACEQIIEDEKDEHVATGYFPAAARTSSNSLLQPPTVIDNPNKSNNDTVQIEKRNGKWYSHGIEILNQETQQSLYQRTHHPPLTEPAKELLLRAKHYIHQALVDIHRHTILLGSALTGGGDTRLLLAFLPSEWKNDLRFQTHNLQATDASIARMLAKEFQLDEHKLFRPITTNQRLRQAIIHDQIPLRKRSTLQCLPVSERFRQIQNRPTHVLHGRFGTEFLGFLCFDKSSLVGPPEEMDATSLEKDGNFIFAKQDWPNPLSSLEELWRQLEEQGKLLMSEYNIPFDVGYALQLQLFTRAFCCDIYGGLRKASWFALPYAFFLRNECSPFLDTRLLRMLTCRLSAEQKVNPYEWYGDLYQVGVPESFRSIPCNNKMLSIHSQMPCAVKKPQQQLPEYISRTIRSTSSPESGHINEEDLVSLSSHLLSDLYRKFSPEFWDGAMMITRDSKSTPIEQLAKSNDSIESMVKALGPEKARIYSIRLGSVLLWVDNRFG